MNIVFFDTETTGADEKDVLCQIAWMQGGVLKAELFKPPFPIPAEASAVHHISNKMVADKETFRDSEHWKEIKALFEDENTVVVAHNAKFDLGMLAKEDIVPKNHICTLRVVRALDPEGMLPKYGLQYLRYKLDLEVGAEAAAHSADGDVLVLEQLFKRTLTKLTETMSEDEALQEMMRLSTLPSLIRTINFGKHAGKSVADVAREDSSYLDWLLKSKLENSPDDEDWIFTLRTHLGKLL
jgi:DNA polymerase-3 subunit epsilon